MVTPNEKKIEILEKLLVRVQTRRREKSRIMVSTALEIPGKAERGEEEIPYIPEEFEVKSEVKPEEYPTQEDVKTIEKFEGPEIEVGETEEKIPQEPYLLHEMEEKESEEGDITDRVEPIPSISVEKPEEIEETTTEKEETTLPWFIEPAPKLTSPEPPPPKTQISMPLAQEENIKLQEIAPQIQQTQLEKEVISGKPVIKEGKPFAIVGSPALTKRATIGSLLLKAFTVGESQE